MDHRRFNTVTELLDNAFSEYRQGPAFTCLDHTLSFADIDRLSRAFASFLQHHTALQPGDRVAVQLPNILAYPVVAFGAIRAGMVLVNTNPLYTARELRHQLKDSGARALVVLANVANTAAEVIADTDVKTVVVANVADLLPWPKRTVVNFVLRHLKKMVPDYNLPQAVALCDALTAGQQPMKPVDTRPNSLLALQYTGGTTGVAKGAMLSHANVCANVDQLLEHMQRPLKEPGEQVLAALPLYHIYAFTLHAMVTFSRGGHNILVPNPRDIPAVIKAIRHRKISMFVGVNTLYGALERYPEFAQLDFSELKVCAGGGMAVTEEVAKRWHQITGCEICEGYGLSETSPVLSSSPDTKIVIGTIGTPLKDTEFKVVDDQGQPVSEGEPGELLVRGPQVMLGYWRNAKATAEAIDDEGWFKTGDIVIRRPDGYYKLVDRKKDIINVSGFKVSPNEVEEVACMHPAVVEAAVIGVPTGDEHGERVKLFVVVSDKDVTADEILAHCRKHLTAYKVPKFVEFRTQLPRSNVGKILRKDLRHTESV